MRKINFFLLKMKLFQFTLALLLCSINCNGQKIEIMGEDSNLIKLELFDLEYGRLKEDNILYLKNETDFEFLNYWFIKRSRFKENLKKALPLQAYEELYKKRSSNMIDIIAHTMWDSILKNKYSNSIQFIKPHRVDDFFFIRDSIKESYNKYSKHNGLYSKLDDSLALVYQKKHQPKFNYSLCSILPLIFSYKHSAHKIDIYAILNSNIFTSNVRDPHSIYGDIGYISLYKRVNNRWILIKIIDEWNSTKGK